MKLKLGISIVIFLAISGSLRGQATNPTAVSGTIVDPTGVPYYPATVLACLTPQTLDPLVDGVHVNTSQGANYCVGPVPTTATGAFTMALFPNIKIAPTGTTLWFFTVTSAGAAPPAGKGALQFSSAITISGTSQDVSAALNAAALVQLNAGGGGTGNVTGTGTTQKASCWNTTTGITNCTGIQDTGSAVNISEQVNFTGPGPFGFGGAEGAPASCLPATSGSDFFCNDSTNHTIDMTLNGSNYVPVGTTQGKLDASLVTSGTHWLDKVSTLNSSSACSTGCTIIVPSSIADDSHTTTITLGDNVNLEFTGSANFIACTIIPGKFSHIDLGDITLTVSGSGCTAINQTNTAIEQVNQKFIVEKGTIDCNGQAGSTGIFIANHANAVIRDTTIINCGDNTSTLATPNGGLVLLGTQFGQFSHLNLWQNYVNLKVYGTTTALGGGGSSNSFYDIKTNSCNSPRSGVCVVLYDQSTSFPQTGNLFANWQGQNGTVVDMAVIGNSTCGSNCETLTLVGGSPESDGGGAASVTIDGNTITKAGAMFTSYAQVTWINPDIEDATATPEFLLNNNSYLQLVNPKGYGNSAGTIVSTDATSTLEINGDNGLLASATLFGGAGTFRNLCLPGATSGCASITAPAVAGTRTNPVIFSNTVVGPDGSCAHPVFGRSSDGNSGMYFNGSNIEFCSGGTQDASLTGTPSLRAGSGFLLTWTSSTPDVSADTGLSRGSTADTVNCGNGSSASDTSCTFNALKLQNGGLTSSAATGALSIPQEVGFVSCTQATCATSATTLYTTGGSVTLYRVDAAAACTSATASATATIVVNYTDASGTAQNLTATVATCTTLGAASVGSESVAFAAQSSTAIQYKVTQASSPQFLARIAIYQEGVN